MSTHAFAGGNPFIIAGVPIAENSALLEAGIDLNLNRTATLGISYSRQIASEARDHDFKVDFTVWF